MYMKLIGYILGTTIFIVSSASGAESTSLLGPPKINPIESIFVDGLYRIMAANSTPECQKMAVNNLSALKAASEPMKCSTFNEKIEDVLSICYQAISSFTSLVNDMNTIFNGVPLCFSNTSFWNFFSIIPCVGKEIGNIWTALWDFIDYSNYYKKTLEIIKQFEDCLHKQQFFTESVEKIVADLRACQ